MSEIDVPVGWRCKPISDIAISYSGGTPRTSIVKYWDDGIIPWLRSGELKNNILKKSGKFITQKGLDESSAKLWPKNTVLIAITGANVGNTAFLDFESSGNQSIVGILPSTEIIPKFMWYYLQFSYGYFWSKITGGAQPHINGKVVSQREIIYPKIETQKKIVKKLDSITEKINKQKNLLLQINSRKNLIDLQKILSYSFFDYSSLEISPQISLGDILLEKRYGTSTKSVPEDIGTPVIRIPNIKTGEIDFSNMKYTKLTTAELEKLKLISGDIVVCRTNGSLDLIGKSALIRNTERVFAFASYLIRLRPDQTKIHPEYLNYFLASNDVKKYFKKSAKTTTGLYNLNLQILSSLVIPLPELNKQQKIINEIKKKKKIIQQINDRINTSQKLTEDSLEQVSKLIQSSLTAAFSGKLVN